MDPPADYWWWIEEDGLSLSTWSPMSRVSVDENALSLVVAETAIPCLAAIVSIRDVAKKVAGPAAPFVERPNDKAQAQRALHAASDWLDRLADGPSSTAQ